MPDPILVGRDAGKVEQLAKQFNVARWTTDLDKALADKNDTDLLRCRDHAGAAVAADESDQRRQARLLREADRDQSRRGGRGRQARQRQGRQARHRAGQAVPARPEEARVPARFRFLRPHALGARRIRLLGVRGRLAGGAAAVVELSQRRRRRHHPRHGLPLALRARQSLRRGRKRELHSAPRIFPSAGTRRARNTRRPRTIPPTPPSASRAA